MFLSWLLVLIQHFLSTNWFNHEPKNKKDIWCIVSGSKSVWGQHRFWICLWTNWFTPKAKNNSLCWRVWLLSKWKLLVLGPGFSAVWQWTDHFAFNKSTWFSPKVRPYIIDQEVHRYKIKAFILMQCIKRNGITVTITEWFLLEAEMTTFMESGS